MAQIIEGRDTLQPDEPQRGGIEQESHRDQLWVRCPCCRELLYAKEHERSLRVCSKCKGHLQMSARTRIHMVLDDRSFMECDSESGSSRPGTFFGNGASTLRTLQRYAAPMSNKEAFIYGIGAIKTYEVVIGVSDCHSAGAGTAGGEEVTRAIELAERRRVPLVLFSNCRGIDPQEDPTSLLLMAKTLAALNRFKRVGLPYISVMVDPCVGIGHPMLGDVNIAEPGARIGFAVQPATEGGIQGELYRGPVRAEFLQEHGMVDLVLPRSQIRGALAQLVRLYCSGNVKRTVREASV